ncbi:HEPN domain-containing protein [Chitinophaga sp. 22321]|uniref:HEPN domain-containing protein n=1 Tax=Chitinophaga sp. 22321 TaxID=3453909 RepID=UPI003F831EB4
MNTKTTNTTPLEAMNNSDYKILSTIHPAILKAGIESKEAAIDSFFRVFDITECRDFVQNLIKGWASGHFASENDSDDISVMYFFCEQLNILLEACFLIFRENRRRSGNLDDAGNHIYSGCQPPGESTNTPSNITDMETPCYTIQEILDTIIPITQPDMIFLVGQFPDFFNGNRPSYDLLLVLPEIKKRITDQYRNSIKESFLGLSPANVTFITTDGLKAAINQGQIFLSRNCNSKSLVYATSPHLPIPRVNADIKFSDIRESAAEIFKAGGENVRMFLSAAKELIAKQNYKMAAFMLHQVVEHTLRPAILSILDQKKQTHNLLVLTMLSRLFLPESVAALKLDQEEHRSLFELLNNAYVEARYKSDYDISEKSVSELLGMVEEFRANVVHEYYTYLGTYNKDIL